MPPPRSEVVLILSVRSVFRKLRSASWISQVRIAASAGNSAVRT